MSSRHRAREVALQILYRYDVPAATEAPRVLPLGADGKALPFKPGQALAPKDEQSLLEDLGRHFDHFQVPFSLREFSAELVAGTLKNLTQLDTLIEKHASHWKVTRMSAIDRNLLRMSSYEMLNFKDIPRSVTIDEAVELAKQFSTAESSAFINGILDAIHQENAP